MKRILFLIEAALLAVSGALFGYIGYIWWIAQESQAQGHHDLTHVPQQQRLASPAKGSLLGEMEIPRIGLSSIILEGTEAATLRRAVGHIPGTALPGERGNLCLAGHRDTFFRPLRRVGTGDEVVIKTQSGKLLYRVNSVQVVHPEDAGVLDNSATDAVTLVTCYPFNFMGAAPMRLSCEPLESGKRAPAGAIRRNPESIEGTTFLLRDHCKDRSSSA